MSSRTVELQKMTAVESQQNGHFERRSWLSDRRAECKHHEPPKCESYAHGMRSEWDIGKTVMYLAVSEHRIFHERRGILFNSKQDYDEAAAMESRMSFRRKQEYKAIKKNQQSINRIDHEILRRDKELFGEC